MIVEYLGNKPVLFLDLSSVCCGYTIGQFNKDKSEARILKAGAFWFENDITQGLKYNTLCRFIKDTCLNYNASAVVTESYFLNPHMLAGVSVLAELAGSVKSALYDLSEVPSFHRFAPQAWRAALRVKKDASKKGPAAWKRPTKERIEEFLKIKFVNKIESNVTGKVRSFPFDITDSIGVCLGWLISPPNLCKNFIVEDENIITKED